MKFRKVSNLSALLQALFDTAAGEIVFRGAPYSSFQPAGSTSTPIGSSTYQIKKTGVNNEYRVWINGYQALTVTANNG